MAQKRDLFPEPEPEKAEKGYLCARCWKRFPALELTVVQEQPYGKGFRCRNCALAEELGL